MTAVPELSVIAVAVTAAPPASDAFLTSLRIRFDLCLAMARAPLRSFSAECRANVTGSANFFCYPLKFYDDVN